MQIKKPQRKPVLIPGLRIFRQKRYFQPYCPVGAVISVFSEPEKQRNEQYNGREHDGYEDADYHPQYAPVTVCFRYISAHLQSFARVEPRQHGDAAPVPAAVESGV